MGWFWDRTDIPRNRIAAINPASAEFRKYYVQQLKEVWQKYGVDAFFLDVSARVENDANGLIDGLNAGQGNILLHKELAAAMPGVVFGGESLHEVTFFRENFAQRWKNPPQWDPTRRSTPHPISAFLFSPYTVPYGYLGMPNPDRGPQLYQEYLDAYEIWGVLPTLRLWSVADLGTERVRTQELLSVTRTWQQRGFKPDFESDWTPNTLFQYVGENGEIAALKKTETGATLVLPEESLGYERVFGVTQVKTERNIPHWRTYQDGIVNILDIILVAQNLGQKPPSNPRTDVNKDGQVNVLDLVFVADRLGEKGVSAAPSQVDIIKPITADTEEIIVIQRALRELEAIPEKSLNIRITIRFLRLWLENVNRNVEATKLLPNYPNPFNPETWIPYQLAKASDVSMKIYDVSGHLVRTISVGFKPVGYYLTRERAAYWDGRNEAGELVSSGVYFLQFVAGNFTATQRVVIVK